MNEPTRLQQIESELKTLLNEALPIVQATHPEVTEIMYWNTGKAAVFNAKYAMETSASGFLHAASKFPTQERLNQIALLRAALRKMEEGA
jgi:Holliday junction resolvasome RuvABC endonuclease subunit